MRQLKIEELELISGSGVGQDSADYNGDSGDDMDVDHGYLAQANAVLLGTYDAATNSYAITNDFLTLFYQAYPDTYHYEQPDSYTFELLGDYANSIGLTITHGMGQNGLDDVRVA